MARDDVILTEEVALRLRSQLEFQAQRIAELVNTLSFYGNEYNYRGEGCNVFRDRGERARKALLAATVVTSGVTSAGAKPPVSAAKTGGCTGCGGTK